MTSKSENVPHIGQVPLRSRRVDGEPAIYFMFDETEQEDAEIRDLWRALVNHRLPTRARERSDWPVHLNHCFARILLDNAVGKMWRTVIKPPAWRNTPLPVLQSALDLGEGVLSDRVDLWALNDASLMMRGKAPREKKPAPRLTRHRQKNEWLGDAS